MTHIPRKTPFRLSFRNKTKNKRILKHDFKQKHACANKAQPFLKSPIFFEKDPYLKLNYACIKKAHRCLTLNRNIAYTPLFNVYGEKPEFKKTKTLEIDRKNRSNYCVSGTIHFQNENELASFQLTSVLNTQFLTKAKHDILKHNVIAYTEENLATITDQLCQSVKTIRPQYSSVFFNRRRGVIRVPTDHMDQPGSGRKNFIFLGTSGWYPTKYHPDEVQGCLKCTPAYTRKSYAKMWKKKPPLYFLLSSSLRRNKACEEKKRASGKKNFVFSNAKQPQPEKSKLFCSVTVAHVKNQNMPQLCEDEVRIVRRRRNMNVLAYTQEEKSVKRVNSMRNFSNRDGCHSNVLFGTYGVCFERHGTFNAAYIETVAMEGAKLRKKGRAWLRLCCNTPVTARPIETRMGKGKGTISYWETKVRPGQVFLELAGISKARLARFMESLRKKCSMRLRLISF